MKYLFLIALVTGLNSCRAKSDYQKVFNDPLLFCNTVHQLNDVVMGNNFTPIVASRNYLYAAVAAYEVIAAGYPKKFHSLAGQLHGLTTIPPPAASSPVNYQMTALLVYCKMGEAVTFPEGSMRYYVDSLKQLAKDHGMPDEIFNNSLNYVDTVSSAIMNWSKHDNYAETRSAARYTVIDSPGRWVPTPPAYSSASEPHWNMIRNMVIDSINEFMPPPPYPFNITDKNSNYYKEVKKIKDATDSLTTGQAEVADFWDDNPFKLNVSGHIMFATKKFSPGGHWMGIVGIAAKKSRADFQETVYAYAKTSIALFDAFIECWNIKYYYNTTRPETVINKYLDPEWRPHLQTPPFPEYTCGHCTISAACAESLSSIFGDNFSYADTTELEFGIKKRSYVSFREAALENEKARFYGGIHYDYCCVRSNEMGKAVGALVVNKLKMKLK